MQHALGASRKGRGVGAFAPMLATALMIVGVTLVLFLLAAARFAPNVAGTNLGASNPTTWLLRATSSGVGLATGPTGDLAGGANASVTGLVLSSALSSAMLAVPAAVLAAALGIPLGFWIALHGPARFVLWFRALTNLGIALPAFFIAFLLQVGAVELTGRLGRNVVPVYGFGFDTHLIIPVIALSVGPCAAIARLVALAANDLNARDFARTARAKGLSERTVIYRHLAPNMYGTLGEAVLSGSRLVLGALVIVEYLVVWPGLGMLALRALSVQDLPVLLSCVGVIGVVFVAIELALDLVTRRTGLVTG
jgi:peptide/nickel transport system permease protein